MKLSKTEIEAIENFLTECEEVGSSAVSRKLGFSNPNQVSVAKLVLRTIGVAVEKSPLGFGFINKNELAAFRRWKEAQASAAP